jgi:hypothetical protein
VNKTTANAATMCRGVQTELLRSLIYYQTPI